MDIPVTIKEIFNTYDEKNRLIKCETRPEGHICEYEYDENDNVVHVVTSDGYEKWIKYHENGRCSGIKEIRDGITTVDTYDNEGHIIHSIRDDGCEMISEYNEYGELIHFKEIDNENDIYEEFHNYDECNNTSHFTTNSGDSIKYTYDKNRNITHSICETTGYEYWFEYDENGNQISLKDSDGYWNKREYDENGNEIHFIDSDSYEEWSEYDDSNRLIKYKNSTGEYRYYKYNESGNTIYCESHSQYDDACYILEYDDTGKEIHCKYDDGCEWWKSYNENGDLIHYQNSNGYVQTFEYDVNNKLLHHVDSEGNEHTHRYDDRGNCIYSEYISVNKSYDDDTDSAEFNEDTVIDGEND